MESRISYKTHLKLYRYFSNGKKEILPRSVVKRFSPFKKNSFNVSPKPKVNIKANTNTARFNHVNIQMLSRGLYNQIFNKSQQSTPLPEIIEQCFANFKKHNIQISKAANIKDIDFELPRLQGSNLEEHFYNIGKDQSDSYKLLVNEILVGISSKPLNWLYEPGWVRYAPNTKPEKVSFPYEDCMVLDIEVCVNAGQFPILATAVTNKAWYGWVSKILFDGSSKPIEAQQYTTLDLIPLESEVSERGRDLNSKFKKPRVVIGHNVSYDRARIKEQYWINRTGTRFIDTMSLHICVSGVTSYQRAVLKSGKCDPEDDKWRACSSLNSLAEVYKLYCGKELKKETRDIFIEGTLNDVRDNFQLLMNYCSNDVNATYYVLKELFPLFVQRFPHPVTLAGMLEMSTAYLPVNSNWNRYILDAEQTYDDLENESKFLLARHADNACQLLHDFQYREDLWMWDQDWSVQEIKLKKNSTVQRQTKKIEQNAVENIVEIPKNEQNVENSELQINDIDNKYEEKFKYLMDMKTLLPSRKPLLPGYPLWYRKLCSKFENNEDWIPGPHLISTSMQIAPKLLRLTWEGYPLHYIRNQGWGFLVPFSDDLQLPENVPLEQLIKKCPVLFYDRENKSRSDYTMNLLLKDVQENLGKKEYYSKKKKDQTYGAYKGTGIWCNTEVDNCCYFMKLPHKDGISHRVGNPLAKDFLIKFSENVLAGDDVNTEKILSIARMLSYWRNNRERISQQIVVWFSQEELPKSITQTMYFHYGAILPQVVVCGTLTRRAMEPTWMTASNAHAERIGSELRGMVQAPPGYYIVGADVDSQELWIASVIGDASFCKLHGATPFGWMTLSGNKSDGTDMHSITAKAVGISRDHAKVINYARIYGAGQNFAEQLLKQFNPSMSETEAKSKAAKMFLLTKGKRVYQIRDEYKEDFVDRSYNSWEAMKLSKAHGKKLIEMFHKPKWEGGTESAMFNRLEEIAGNAAPITPFLKGRLSRALEPENMSDERVTPTRINWVVQSGAVDFLHLMLVCMRWLMKDKARFVLSFHDEIRYLIPEKDRYKGALAMHITNLFTRAFCSHCLGLNDLPMSVAFFTSVEVDTVLRKECHMDCKTPSNPHGLNKGYGIPFGESLNIFQVLEKTGKNIKF